jgi:universal stress protein A
MYQNILFACDLSENHYELCEKVVNFAHSLKANLQFIHVIETPTSLLWAQSLGFAELSMPVKDGAEAVMKTLGEAFQIPKENLHVEIGSVYQIILEKVKAWDCDLLILGRHISSGLPPFLGSTAHAVAHHPPCDILTML